MKRKGTNEATKDIKSEKGSKYKKVHPVRREGAKQSTGADENEWRGWRRKGRRGRL